MTTPHNTPHDTPSKPPLYRRRWFRTVCEVALVIGVVIGVRAWQHRGQLTGKAPPLAGRAVSGKTLDLSTYRGAPVLLHFWGSWCPVCRAEQHAIVALGEDFPLVTVAAFSGEDDAVQSYLTDHPMGAPTLADPKGALARAYQVKAYPTTFVIDEDGDVQHMEVGYTSEFGLRLRMWWANL